MLPHDVSTERALRELSVPGDGPGALDRRRFLQIVGAGFGTALLGHPLLDALLPDSRERAWAAGPLGPDERVLVVIGMWGGNDGLNTIVPIDDGLYHDQHGSLAVAPEDVLPIDDHRGLHPALGRLKSFWEAGQLAIVEGIGSPDPSLSHFDSIAGWMSGRPAGVPGTGWVGRWLDVHLGGQKDLYAAVEVGPRLSLLMRGEVCSGTVVAAAKPGFGVAANDREQRTYDALRALAALPGDAWHARIAEAMVDQLDVADALMPVVPAQLSPATIVANLEMIGHLVNADLGFRVLTTGWNDFDSHGNQPNMHPLLMAELNEAITRLYEVLTPERASRVTVITYSEFGRTSWANDGQGTDHGTAAPHVVIGPTVNGGVYGQRPALAGLGRWDRMAYHVDFRDYFGSVIDGWLDGGASEVFDGRSIDDLGLFHLPVVDPSPTTTVPPTPTTILPPPTTVPNEPSPPAPVPVTGNFVPVHPTRLLDTRSGVGGPTTPLGPGTSVDVQITGVAGVPASGVTAVAVNVTAVNATVETYFRVYPAGGAVPYASSLNPLPGRAVPNMAIVGVGHDGSISVRNELGEADCIVDVLGYFGTTPGATLNPLVPARLLDTRNGDGAVAAGPVHGPAVIDVQVTGRGGVPTTGVEAVVLNVGSIHPTEDGYVTIWASGEPRPDISNLNYVAGANIPNLSICNVGDGGKIALYVDRGDVHLIADVVAYFGTAAGTVHHAVSPQRLLDTRDGTGTPPGALRGGAEAVLQVTGRASVPANATAVVLNVTATNAVDDTFVTVYPDGVSLPNASSLNVTAHRTIANLVVVKLGDGGRVRLFNSTGSLDLIADVNGYFV